MDYTIFIYNKQAFKNTTLYKTGLQEGFKIRRIYGTAVGCGMH